MATTASDPTTDAEFSVSGDISGDGGVVKEIVSHGTQGWMKPEDGDEVHMHYRGTLQSGGDEFDSSYSRGIPFSFKLGEGKVIKGWDLVGKTMAKGEKARVTLKPEYAYGASGSPPKIPANATLVFDMELVSWTSQRDVFGDGTVMRTEVESGDGWERPGKLAEVTMDIRVFSVSEDDMDVDGKSGGTKKKEEKKNDEVMVYEKNGFVATLGASQMPEQWERIVPEMKRNNCVHLVCKPPRLLGAGLDGKDIGIDLKGATCMRHEVTLRSWRKIEDVASDGSVMKKVLSEGDGWERPGEGATATIDVSVHLVDPTTSHHVVPSPATNSDKQTTSPVLRTPDLVVKVGDGMVIDGLDRVLQTMKVGEQALAYLQPSAAYGSAPSLLTEELRTAGIDVSSSVLIEVTLTSFEKGPDVWGMSTEQKMAEMTRRKTRGNTLFKDKRYDTARKSYQRAVSLFESSTADLEGDVKTQVNDLLVSCHLNMAMCYDRKNDPTQALTHCKKALEIQPANVKALYRQGCAYLELDDFYNAQSSLRYAKELAPGNGDVVKKLRLLKEKRVRQDAQDKKLFSNMFGRMSKMEDKEKKKDVMDTTTDAAALAGKETTQTQEEGNGTCQGNGNGVADNDKMETDCEMAKAAAASTGPPPPPDSGTAPCCSRGVCSARKKQ